MKFKVGNMVVGDYNHGVAEVVYCNQKKDGDWQYVIRYIRDGCIEVRTDMALLAGFLVLNFDESK